MHTGIFYYVINLGLLLVFSFIFMGKYWTEEKFEQFTGGSDKDKEAKK